MAVRDVAARTYREALPALAVGGAGGLFAGLVLGGMRSELRTIPGLLVLVPALLATRGNVYAALGAKLSTALHQGLLVPEPIPDDRRAYAAVAAAMLNGVAVSAFAAVVAYAVLSGLARPTASLPALAGIAVVAGFISGVALTVVVVGAAFAGYRRGSTPTRSSARSSRRPATCSAWPPCSWRSDWWSRPGAGRWRRGGRSGPSSGQWRPC